jgi:hypothetical protein
MLDKIKTQSKHQLEEKNAVPGTATATLLSNTFCQKRTLPMHQL